MPADFLQKLRAVTAKRPKTAIDHILEFGHITTEELRDKYGYDHPPRAIRDVKEHGIPLEMFRVEGSHGRKIAAYKFGDPSQSRSGGFGGRKAWPKDFKQKLVDTHGARCGICCTAYAARYLQIDHRVPFEVAGDKDEAMDVADYMLVCGSCNRAKSWSCEHCKNWTEDRIVSVCQTCYWANPIDYAHVALRLIRRLDVTWSDSEVPEYDQLLRLSKHARKRLPDFVKEVLRDALGEGMEPK
ncbi:MAG: HNH endonuclease [Deltaproteobacteria bacterium]|nr:HNH endonuclease [Deltaproteobacteria bacterium]